MAMYSAWFESLTASDECLFETGISESDIITSMMSYMHVMFCYSDLGSKFFSDSWTKGELFKKLGMQKKWISTMIGECLNPWYGGRCNNTYSLRIDA